MALPLWIGFQPGSHLKCWYCDEDHDWVRFGEVLIVENLVAPMFFSVPRDQFEYTWKRIQPDKWKLDFGATSTFQFVLDRDDSSGLPVYEQGAPPTKIMSVFAEFTEAISLLVQALGLTMMGFESTEQPGVFKLQVRFLPYSNLGDVLRTLGLLRAGMEILSFTRGFQMSNLCWRDLPVDGNLFSKLEEQLCF